MFAIIVYVSVIDTNSVDLDWAALVWVHPVCGKQHNVKTTVCLKSLKSFQLITGQTTF